MRSRMLLVPVLFTAFGFTASLAQPPQGDRKGYPGGGERRVDPQVEAWVKTLVEKITDPHDEIRESARAGLVAVGRPALTSLRPLMEGEDGAKATAARKIIDAIEAPRVATATAPRSEGTLSRNPNANTPRADGDRPNGLRPPGGGPGGPNPMETLLDDLGLNDKQRKQADDMMKETRDKSQEIMQQVQDGKLDRDEARAKRREIQDGMLKKLKELMSEEQFAKFEEGMRNMPRPPRGGEGPPRPDKE